MDIAKRNRELIKTAGGREAVGRHFKVTGQAVGLWYATGVPGDKVIPLCSFASFRVTPHQLRPDLYPHPDDGLPHELRGAPQPETAQEAAE